MRRTFDHLARWYRVLEVLLFRGALERARTEQMDALAQCPRILLLGEGDGRFAQELLRRYPSASITIVERSQGMLKRCRQRLGGVSESSQQYDVQYIEADIGDWLARPTSVQWDAIVTLFFLDCFEDPELANIVSELARRLCPKGLWLYADFQQTEHGLHRVFTRALIRVLYIFFAVQTDIRARRLVDPRPWLRHHKLSQKTRCRSLGGLLVSELWQKHDPHQRKGGA